MRRSMGRAKATGRMPKSLAQTEASVKKVDGLKILVDYVESFPDTSPVDDESAGGLGEPPAKRPRTTRGLGFIAITRQEFSFTARATAPSPHPVRICRSDVGKYLRIYHDTPSLPSSPIQIPDHVLSIAPRHGNKVPEFCFRQLLSPELLPEALSAALIVATTQGFDPESKGCLWASTDIEIRQDGTQTDIKLTIEVRWNESEGLSAESRTSPQHTLREHVFGTYYPGLKYYPLLTSRSYTRAFYTAWPPKEFYEACYIPNKEDFDPELMHAKIPNLTAELFPFQRRSLHWLLNREGVSWTKAADSDESRIQPFDPNPLEEKPISFAECQDMHGQSFWASPLFGVISRDPALYRSWPNIKGGILAEEMGLGKTLEIIGLLLLHRRPAEPDLVFDPFLGRNLRPTGATLIITPLPLLSQWQSEIGRHAPHLKVTYYPGFRASAKDRRTGAELVDELASQDVVITTYEALRPEFYAAIEPPPRSMRGEKKYERVTSPLMQLSWWRVCIDEGQMVENWTNNTAILARLIPRVNVWAISGTPVKDDIEKDLRGLLTFLRLEPYASDARICNALFRCHKEVCRKLFNLICLRHTKGMVRNEIALPLQKRYVITMPFSAVEEQHYQTLFRRLTRACGLDTLGNPIAPDWDFNDPYTQHSMRVALDRLRQTALHPEVGAHNRRALGRRAGALRTVSEVLDAMLEHSEASIRTDQRSLLQIKLTRGQILAGLNRVQEARTVWEEVLKSSTALVSDCRDRLEQEAELARTKESNHSEPDPEDEDKEETIPIEIKDARRRLRYALEIQHKAVFYCANAYFTIKSNIEMTTPESDEFQALEKKEIESYDLAKLIRKDILHDTHSRAKKLMDKIASTAAKQAFAVVPEFKSMDDKGIESRRVADAFTEFCGALDDQANQLDEWREHVIQLLLKPLLDEEHDDLTGEEYEDSAKLQDEITVYVQVLRTVIADRQAALSGQKNFLVDHEYQGAIRQAKEEEGACPAKVLELFAIRDALNPEPIPGEPLTSLRGIVSELRALVSKFRREVAVGNQRANAELTILTKQLTLAQSQLTEQTKAAVALEQEIEQFTNSMNTRLDFYRQLQAVSDMVADYDGVKTDDSLAAQLTQEETAERALATAESKHRYLLHLKDADSGEEQQLCIICQSNFSAGVLTVCGHKFCKECITLWFRAHRTCPICKRHLNHANLHDITLKRRELKIHADSSGATGIGNHTEHSVQSQATSIYAEFSPEKLIEINNIELDGPSFTFTTKVDTLVRHLFWLRDSDPGAKSIIFSQYKEFLDVLALAFERYHIGYTAFDKANGITSFKEDPAVEVFLLHARAHSSGLNLVNASHVFLCEPLLNTALELQAIARVDRIGQEHETTVWLYLVDGTVEQSIYNLSVQRRLEHMDQSHKKRPSDETPELLAEELDVANSLELQQAHISKLMGTGEISGEAVDKKDLWTCLFGHVKAQRQDEEIRNNSAIRGLLAAEAAEERMNGGGEAAA